MVSGSVVKYGFLFFMQPRIGFADARLHSLEKETTENRWKSRHTKVLPLMESVTYVVFSMHSFHFLETLDVLFLAVNYLLLCSFSNVWFYDGLVFTRRVEIIPRSPLTSSTSYVNERGLPLYSSCFYDIS